MAFYLVSARPREDHLSALRLQLAASEIAPLKPFGPTLQDSLERARIRHDGTAVWEEEDYCSPPLQQERAAVLDEYFLDIRVEPVEEGEGWEQIDDLPSLWN